MKRAITSGQLDFHPLTTARWGDFVKLFGKRGACGGCWCMWWRLKRSEYEEQKGEGNKAAMRAIVEAGEPPGLVGYLDDEPIAWCSVAPRERYSVLDRSRVLKRIDDRPVWSVVCFFVAKQYRRMGVSRELLNAAVAYCREQGATIVEGYPIEPKKPDYPDLFAGTGLASAFEKAGFQEVVRRSETRPIMRYDIAE